jgi:hypothetical protein
MKEDKIIRCIQILGIIFFYIFAIGFIAFLLNGIRNGWIYRISFPHAVVISSIIIPVIFIVTYVISMVFWGISKGE